MQSHRHNTTTQCRGPASDVLPVPLELWLAEAVLLLVVVGVLVLLSVTEALALNVLLGVMVLLWLQLGVALPLPLLVWDRLLEAVRPTDLHRHSPGNSKHNQ